MGSKILKAAENINKPLVNTIVVRGWYLRLLDKKRRGKKFRTLTTEEKQDIKEYWRGYGKRVSPDWCSYFSYGSGIVDKKYIPESLYYGEILRKLNDYSMGGLSNKNVADQIFSSKQPKTILRKNDNVILTENFEPIKFEEGLKLCNKAESIIIKPSTGTYGGSGIEFWNKDDGIDKLRRIIGSQEKLIIQEILKQHPFFEEIHPSSLNTLRIVSLLVDGRPIVLSSILRMGQNNKKVDNYSAGGIICPIDKDGFLFEEAVQSDQSVIDRHPDGFVFKGNRIPYYEKIIDDMNRQHYRIPYFKLVSWDYALTPDGIPVLVEANIPASQLDLHQLNIGPLFGEHTDRVLDFVYKGGTL